MRYFFIFILSLFIISCANESKGENAPEIPSKKFAVEEVYRGKGVLWGFDFIDKSRVVISHRKGDLFLYNLDDKSKVKLNAPSVQAKGQGGLLDVHYKKIKDKSYIYVTFSEKIEGDRIVTSLARAPFENNKAQSFKTIFRSNAHGGSPIHFGSRLVFSDDAIFMTIGDRSERDLAQDIGKHNGSVLRLTLEGKAHPENPFVGKEGLDEIYSYGHRNPQGIAIHPKSGQLYSVEMGPRGGDELNMIEKGTNYGWPLATYGAEYYGPKIAPTHKEGTKQPATYWVPSISPSGMVFYTGDKVKEWKNHLFLANLSGQHVRKLELANNKVKKQTSLFKDMKERFRHVRSGPDGYLYLSTDSGKLLKVGPKK